MQLFIGTVGEQAKTPIAVDEHCYIKIDGMDVQIRIGMNSPNWRIVEHAMDDQRRLSVLLRDSKGVHFDGDCVVKVDELLPVAYLRCPKFGGQT